VNPPERSRDLRVIAERCRVSGTEHRPAGALAATSQFPTTIAMRDSREIHVIARGAWRILP
jgi:hypothetical protein